MSAVVLVRRSDAMSARAPQRCPTSSSMISATYARRSGASADGTRKVNPRNGVASCCASAASNASSSGVARMRDADEEEQEAEEDDEEEDGEESVDGTEDAAP